MKHWITRPNTIKFILATLAFYLLLSFNVFHVGETIAPESKDYLSTGNQSPINIQTSGEQYIQEAIDEIQSQPSHGAATNEADTSKTKFQTVCDSNTTLCKKVNFEGTFTSKEKFLYISSIFKVAQFIDKYIITKQQIDETINKVAINKNSGRRGYATRDTVVLNIGTVTNTKEFLELVSHEMGHILDLGVIQGSSDTKTPVFTEFGKAVFSIDDISILFYALSRDSENTRKSSAGQKDFCSGYGMSDPFEDLAECFNLYTHHNNLFKKFALANKIMKKKYNFIAALFGGTYISKGVDTMKADTRPRDTTKIN